MIMKNAMWILWEWRLVFWEWGIGYTAVSYVLFKSQDWGVWSWLSLRISHDCPLWEFCSRCLLVVWGSGAQPSGYLTEEFRVCPTIGWAAVLTLWPTPTWVRKHYPNLAVREYVKCGECYSRVVYVIYVFK